MQKSSQIITISSELIKTHQHVIKTNQNSSNKNHHTPSTSNISTKQNSIDASLCDSLEDDDDDDDDDKIISHFKNNIKQGLNYLLGFYAPALASNTTPSNTIFKSNFNHAFQKQAKYLVFCVFRI